MARLSFVLIVAALTAGCVARVEPAHVHYPSYPAYSGVVVGEAWGGPRHCSRGHWRKGWC